MRLVPDGKSAASTGILALALAAAPWVLPEYWLSQLIFVSIYSLAGLGLMLLVGYTGQLSVGHAAFLGIGAYAQAALTNAGLPFWLAFAAAASLAAATGAFVGLVSLRMRGLYLTVATLALGKIIEEILARWESVTGGNVGLHVGAAQMLGWKLVTPGAFYALCLAVLVPCVCVVLNLLRSASGRALVAIRDSEVSARSLGVNVFRAKTTVFALSALFAGMAGALYAHQIRFLSPDQFGLAQSVELLMLVVIGGLGSIRGVILGSIFMIAVPQCIGIVQAGLPPDVGQSAGLQTLVYGFVIAAFVLFEPQGLNGRWLRMRGWLGQHLSRFSGAPGVHPGVQRTGPLQ